MLGPIFCPRCSVPCLLLMLSTDLNKETSLKDTKPQILMFPSQFAIVPNVKHVGVECVKCEKCQKRKKSCICCSPFSHGINKESEGD